MAASSPRKAAAPRKAAPRKAAAASKAKSPAPEPEDLSLWRQLQVEAAEIRESESGGEYLPDAPFIIDGLPGGQKIVIEAPRTSGQMLAIASMLGDDGTIHPRHVRDMLAAICGDSWVDVYSAVADQDYTLLAALLNRLVDHFKIVPGVGARRVEGNW